MSRTVRSFPGALVAVLISVGLSSGRAVHSAESTSAVSERNSPAAEGSDSKSAGLTLDELFPADRVLDVQITVQREDWDILRFQTRDVYTALGAARLHGPVPSPFTYVPASVTIDGVELPKVGLRKKGFLGSLSSSRPSLKIKLNHVDPEGGIEGLRNLTLNNNQQDTSLVSQYLSYRLFNAVGSPAPRCAFARVTVNGRSLGIYSHVETARRPLLARGYGDASGVLYEGTIVDFYEDWENSFEHKLGDDAAGRAKIKELIDAISGSGGDVLAPADALARAWVPTNGDVDDIWMKPEFDDSSWISGKGGAGYENDSGYESLLAPEFDFKADLFGRGQSVYVRLRFTVDDPASISELVLRMKFDDGFVAYLNGHRIASANAPEDLSWTSGSTGPNGDGTAVSFQPFFVSEHRDKLRQGENVLALHGLNVEPTSSDMLIAGELRGRTGGARAAIGDFVDLDAFYRYWALEGLLGFWDGYSGNRNNFFVYLNPKSGKIHFLPWGADSLFEKYSKINPDRSVPISVKTEGLIAHRLYQTSGGRERYLDTLQSILDEHWKEDALLAEVDRIEKMLEPHLESDGEQRGFGRHLDRVRTFIRNRRADIAEETKDGMPIWTRSPGALPLIPAGAPRNRFGGNRGRDDGADPPDDLWAAARAGDIAALKRHLETTDVDEHDGLGSTALSWAAGLGRLKAVRFLLENGADADAKNRDGTTPLDGTARELDENAARFLFNVFRVKVDPDEVNAAKPKIAELLRKHGAAADTNAGQNENDR